MRELVVSPGAHAYVWARVVLVPEILEIAVGGPGWLLAAFETMLTVTVAVLGELLCYLRAGSHSSFSEPGAKGQVSQATLDAW